jgi:cell division protein FtsQ
MWPRPSGAETGTGLVNKAGEVFEANLGELDREGLPRLQGPEGSAPRVLQMYRALEPALKPLDVALDSLTLDARGSWDAGAGQRCAAELGGGTTEDILQRVQRFVRTLPQITSQYKRSAAALESADLRYEDGYALRLKGVTTGTSAPATAARARR